MKRWYEIGLLVLILLLAAGLRLTGIDWDGYYHYHPDERYITWVATAIEWPDDWQTALQPHESSFNPYYWPPDAASDGIVVEQDQPRDFAYGHLPLYLAVAATRLVERLDWLTAVLPPQWLLTRDILNGAGQVEFFRLTAVARALTGLIDVGTVGLIYLLGRRLYGVGTGLLAAAFLAMDVMHIQLAHFFTVDPYMTFFVVAAVYFMVRTGEDAGVMGSGDQRSLGDGVQGRKLPVHRVTNLLLPAVFVGLAVGSKFTAVLLFLPLAVVVFIMARGEREQGSIFRSFVGLFFVTFLVAIGVFFVTNPFALLDFSCQVITPAVQWGPVTIPRLNWGSCFLENISTQNGMARGGIDLPFTRQYTGTLPFLYFIEMQLKWGMGLLLGLLAFAGFVWAIWDGLKIMDLRFKIKDLRLANYDQSTIINHQSSIINHFIVLAWVVPYFLVTGSFYVKFMRYWQPITPFLLLFGAEMVMSLEKRWRWGVTAVTFIFTTLYAIGFVNLYSQPHPWITASEWIYANVEPGTLILSEQWDDSLPSSMWIGDAYRRRAEYPNAELTWHTGTSEKDNTDKLAANLELLAEAEYVTIVSNRVYGVVPRLPEKYPLSSQYHQLLFDGKLGYEVVAVYGRFPHLFGFNLKPDTFGWPGLQPPALVADYLADHPGINWGRADESFIAYDQPLTMIFRNTGHLTAEEMAAQFTR
ncbi:MAG: phospholipid carrier-dependent glycosyltransferase [Ardenticatenaceae bacterium]|nr:phospholipid carrier-dependent glycosyltransferase [Ardenticatenaceae bacterium]MCB9443564.1 phospholipid carrier-dependent glycosyltransferase [Ardenticatenaceae bacterium]